MKCRNKADITDIMKEIGRHGRRAVGPTGSRRRSFSFPSYDSEKEIFGMFRSRRSLFRTFLCSALCLLSFSAALACTDVVVGRDASVDGSVNYEIGRASCRERV